MDGIAGSVSVGKPNRPLLVHMVENGLLARLGHKTTRNSVPINCKLQSSRIRLAADLGEVSIDES
jgi:hypothetical protein